MINGAHAIIYSSNSDADRSFLKDVLGLPNVDVGGGWLIFGLPPAEVAVHPGENNGAHELYLMCEDIGAFVTDMAARNLGCTPVQDQGWGLLTEVTLPGGGKLGVYQPRHERPEPAGAKTVVTKAPAVRAKAAAKKKPAAKKVGAKKVVAKKVAAKKKPAPKKKTTTTTKR
jgi:hypothetical protein